jgi:DNA-binding protein H-NS
MANPLVTKDLAEQILELREDVERQLKANKYYIALHKLDELLAAIKPLETVEATAVPVETPKQEAEPAPAAAIESDSGRTWSGIVQESVVEGDVATAP